MNGYSDFKANYCAEIQTVIKIGGALITEKTKFETLHADRLDFLCNQLAGLPAGSFVVVHGAGSFGHHTAAEGGVQIGVPAGKSLQESENVRHGFVRTRSSVTQLNRLVVDSLLKHGVPAVGFSPFPSWHTCGGGRVLSDSGLENIRDCLTSGLTPVLHGDAVLDETQGCSILSGDSIVREICQGFDVRRCLMLTDVEGVFDRPPHQSGARLVRTLFVDIKARELTQQSAQSIETSIDKATHDTTGGMQGKVDAAVDILVASCGRTVVRIASGIGSSWNNKEEPGTAFVAALPGQSCL